MRKLRKFGFILTLLGVLLFSLFPPLPPSLHAQAQNDPWPDDPGSNSQQLNPNPPAQPVRLVFIHHSVGEDWLREGGLLQALNDNNYYVTDTDYDWGPPDQDVQDGHPIGYHTDIGHWYNWFLGPHRDTYLQALYTNDHLTTGLQNTIPDPGGENTIIMFKSCFSSGQVIYGNPDDPLLPRGTNNPLWGVGVCDDPQCSGSNYYTVSNIKGLYRDLLDYFATRQDKLFILITTPPSLEGMVDAELAAKLRAINNWLVHEWLSNYPHNNVFVFDYYNVLTSNGGDHNINDAGADTGNHHRYNPTTGQIEHIINLNYDFLAYGSDTDNDGVPDDNHPTAAAHQKATEEFIPLLNIAYNRWRATVPPTPLSDLEITKSDSPDPVRIGKRVTYNLTVVNHGPDPVEYADVEDMLPFQASFVSASPSVGNASYDQQSHTVNWHIPGLDVNQQATLNIIVEAPYDTAYPSIVNTATVTCAPSSLDPNDQNNTVTEETRLKWEEDGDGVADSEEQGPGGDAPNYDGNGDGTSDWQQPNVASLHTFDGSYYVTLACSGGEFRNVFTMDNPHPQDAPQDVNFPWGFFSFEIELDPGVSEATVTLYLPQGSNPTTYYKYGPTPDDRTDHWYEFRYDDQTGAEINGDVITLHFVDGGRGDDDLERNGVIVDQGGPGVPAPSVRNIRTNETFSTISEAVRQALEGDTLVVEGQGELADNVSIDKSLTIRAASDANVTVRAEDPSKPVFSIAADGVVIQGLEITGATGLFSAGVRLIRSHNCIISDNTITGNDIGIYLDSSDENFILNNEIRDNGQGIYLYGSNDNLITGNTISDNQAAGISFAPTGGGSGNRISHNLLEGNQVGLELPSGSNLIFLNTVRGNRTGVLTGSRPQGNFIFLNDFLQNTNNVLSDAGGSPTQWHTLVEVDYRYNDQEFHGYLGNYWDDYLQRQPQGRDADHNGVWDDPYPIDNDNDDLYPLVDQAENYEFDENVTPLIAVRPERVDFHTVILGQSSTRRVVIRNLSGLRVQIGEIRLEGGDADQFSIESSTASVYLSPYGSREVVLAFSPTSLGLKRTRLIIPTEAFNDTFEIPVEGICGLVGLPRTGQTECYDPDGYLIDRYDRVAAGMDGQVQAGVPWPLDATERFIDNGDGTVTDTLTGLMWLKCANPIKRFHEDFDTEGTPDGLVSWEKANQFIQGMNDGTFSDCNAGYTDWRLPGINELESLVNYGEEPYLWLGSWKTGTERVFEDVVSNAYWSSTRRTVVIMGTGESYRSWNDVACVWPVRGPVADIDPIVQLPRPSHSPLFDHGVDWPLHRFEVYQDVIVDKLTGLMWTRSADLDGQFFGREVDWEEALDLVKNLDVGGYTDWRLPNIRELRSLIDYGGDHPDDYLYSQGFENLSADHGYWTSTTETGGSHNRAFCVWFRDGSIGFHLEGKSGTLKVMAVRGGVIVETEEWGPEGRNDKFDGNGDHIPDCQQPNVASLHTFDGERYVTIASPDGTVLEDVRPVDPKDIPQSPPEGLELEWGLFSFRIENIPPGGSATVTIYLHGGSVPSTYYKYGPEPTNPSPHWYEFSYDGQTGAEIRANERKIILHFVDGGRGDADLAPNGVIADPGGPARFTGVENRFPIIDSFTAEPSSGVAPLVVSFTCIAHDPDGTIVSYEWDFDGDGVVDETTVDGSTSYTYEGPGTYWAQVTVVDDRGASTPSNQVPIVVGSPIIAPGDVNQDGQVNSTDLALVARAFGSTPQSPNWNRNADLNRDGIVDIFDLVLVGRNFGRGVPSGRVFYVSPDGDDSNPGTREEPWATPGYGSRQLRPGDTLVILGGRYTLSEYDADIITPPSGEPGRWITIRGEEGNRPILAGRDNLLTAMDLSRCSYVRIENLEITSDDQASGEARYFRDGIEILGRPASHIVLKDLYIHHLDEFGMNIQDVNDLQILNCRIEYCGFGAIGGPEGTAGGWRNVLIRGCRLSYSGHYYQGVIDNPANPYDRPDGFGIEPSEGPVEIADTVAEHNKGDGIDSKARNTYIHNCIVANNSCDGVKLWGGGSRVENTLIYGRGDGNPATTPWSPIVISTETSGAGFEIINVTVDDALGENYLMHVQYDFPDTPVTLTIKNTIFCGRGPNSPIFIGRASTLVAEHNLFYLPRSAFVLQHGDTTYTLGNISQLGEGNIYGDPLFASPAWGVEGDYHLQPGSPAIDAGTCEEAPDVDLEYTPRPQGVGCDMGAYER